MPTHKPRQRRGLTVDHRRALVLLASCPEGCTEAVMQAHGFTVEQIVALVRAGRAHVQTERILAGVHMIEVTRMRITDAGPSSTPSMTVTKTHFACGIDRWDADGNSIVEHVAGCDDLTVAVAAHDAA